MKIRPLLTLGRVSNLPTCVSNAIAGFSLGGGLISKSPASLLAAIFSIVCFYESGMILNDLLDREIDRRERPGRPIPAGEVSPFLATTLFIALTFLGLATVVAFFRSGLPIALVLIGLIAAYNFLHLRIKCAPLLMGACRGCTYLLSATAAGWAFSGGSVWLMTGALCLYISAVSFIARDELQDDFPLARVFLILIAIITLFLPLFYGPLFYKSSISFMSILAWIAGIAWLISIGVGLFLRRIHTMAGVGKLLAGMCLLDALVISTNQPPTLAIIAWICFAATLFWHRLIQGT